MNRRRRAAALALLLLAMTLPAASFSAPAAADGPGYSKTQTLTRVHKEADGSDTVADSRSVTVKVDRVSALKSRQKIAVSWSGAHPSGGVVDNQFAANATLQEYPVVIMQCHGDEASGTLAPSTCWTQGIDQRKDANQNSGPFPPWRLDRYATAAERKAIVGAPDPLPAACVINDTVVHYEPFVSSKPAGSIVYRPLTSHEHDNDCGAVRAPEMVNVENPAVPPGNTTFAATDAAGNGSANFVVWTGNENASLGCTSTTSCSIVVIPIMGISCDTTAAGLPEADRPRAGNQARLADEACRAEAHNAPGEFLFAPTPFDVNLAVSGLDWWSASNWRNRFSVKLDFAPAADLCATNDNRLPTDLFGSELMIEATAQWAPLFCSDPKRFKFRHVQMGEPLAKSGLAEGTLNAALISRPPDDGAYGDRPVVNAPIGLTGFVISYIIDNEKREEFKNLKLNPRLIAKLMTESYPTQQPLKEAFAKLAADDPYRAMENNPLYVSVDPEFIALNPGVGPARWEALSGSTLLALSGNSDVMQALTAYLDADPEARAFLNGDPDPWGMVVNPNYKGIALPVPFWPLLDTFTTGAWNPYNTCGLTTLTIESEPLGPLLAAPLTTLPQVVDRVQFGQSNAHIRCTVTTDQGGDPAVVQLVPYGRQRRGDRFVMGITSLAEARYYQLDTAALQTTSTVGPKTKFTSDAGRTFALPGDDNLKAAMALAEKDNTANLWVMKYDKLRTKAEAYPGTLPVYAAVATAGAGDDGPRLADLLTFAVTDGQTAGLGTGQLPPGYVPLTAQNGFAEQVAYTLAAAVLVKAQKGELLPFVKAEPTPAPTATSGSGSGSGTGSGSGSGGGSGSGSGTAAGSTGVPNTGSRPSASATPSASASAPPPVAAPVGMTALLSSALAKWALPVVLLAALCAGGSGLVIRLATGFIAWRRRL